jgi:pilus assembly protein Flp/PilA
MISNLKRLWREDEGATAVEYGLIVAAIAMTVVLIFMLIGNKANNTLNNVAAKFP